MNKKNLIFGIGLNAFANSAFASLPCDQWGEASKIGSLNHELLPEASGLVVSRSFRSRLYHVNDTGSDGSFVVTNSTGGNGYAVGIKNFTPHDMEDLAIGPCGTVGGSCIFAADIGDNDLSRSSVDIILIKEKEKFAAEETPVEKLTLRYPDGKKHNAEGFSVHPNGDIYVVTKGNDTGIYRLSLQMRQSNPADLKLEYLGAFNIPSISQGTDGKNVVTSFDIGPDGKTFLVLTYTEAFEVNADLGTLASGELDFEALRHSGRIRRINIDILKKQESIAYLPEGKGFLYSTESKKKDGELMQVLCK